MHADRANRAVLLLLGLLLLAAGVAGLLASLGVFGAAFAHRALFDNGFSRYVGANGTWLWPVTAVAAFLLGLLVLRWLAALLLSTDRAGPIRLPGDRRAGRTVVEPAALVGAVVAEVEGYRGVESAKGRLVGSSADPRLVLLVAVAPDGDLAAVRRRVEAEALAHARAALGRPDLPARLDLRLGRRSAERVA